MRKSALIGAKIGSIRLVDDLGRGGMGNVYVGHDEKLDRLVAVKAIHEHLLLDQDTRDRFLHEARMLSQLQHPNICQIYDHIEDELGDFLVLELIEGRSLKEVCRQELEPALKMEISEQLVEALITAHEKGIVHRDLKPANVMIASDEHPAPGRVKVLDFGLARLAEDQDTVEEIVARHDAKERKRAAKSRKKNRHEDTKTDFDTDGPIEGTAAYMSPEQARGEPPSAAGDMYSLGLLLQELWTGSPAYDPKLPLLEQLQLTAKAETRPIENLDPDLTALIERLLASAPGARPSARDTLERLHAIRDKPRRRRQRIAALAAVAFLTAVAVVMSFLSMRLSQEVERANTEAATAAEVSGFLEGLFEISDPDLALGEAITARQILDEGAEKIDRDLSGQPLTQARLMTTMGKVYRQLGLYEPAGELLAKALDLRDRFLPENHLDLARTLQELALLENEQGDYAAAERLARRALGIREHQLGSEATEVAECLDVLGTILKRRNKLESALARFERSLAIRRKSLGQNTPEVVESLVAVAGIHHDLAAWERAEPLYEEALAIARQILAEDHPDLGDTISDVGVFHYEKGDFERADDLFGEALEIWEKAYGPDHPQMAHALNNLGVRAAERGEYEAAVEDHARSLEIWEKVFGPDHPDVALALTNLAYAYTMLGEYEEAAPRYERAIAIAEKKFGTHHPDVLWYSINLANLYGRQKRFGKAEDLFGDCLSLVDTFEGENEDNRRRFFRSWIGLEMAMVYDAWGRPEDARWTREGVIELLDSIDLSSERIDFVNFKARALLALERLDEARPLVEKLLEKDWQEPHFLRLCRFHELCEEPSGDVSDMS